MSGPKPADLGHKSGIHGSFCLAKLSLGEGPEDFLAKRNPHKFKDLPPGINDTGTRHGFNILIHIVSHSDILLQIGTSDNATHIAKPRPHMFQSICAEILQSIKDNVVEVGLTLQPLKDAAGDIVTGFQLGPATLEHERWEDFEFREEEEVDKSGKPRVCGVHFPKVCFLMPKWISSRKESLAAKTVYCVSATTAVGETATSTVAAGGLLLYMIGHIYGGSNLTLELISSGAACDLMRYDDNVKFVMNEIIPRLQAHRSALATWAFEHKEENWMRKLSVVLSLTDAVPARVSAVTAALREFRPSTLHIFNVSNVRGMNQIRRKEVQLHGFSKMEMLPSQPVTDLDVDIQDIVARMKEYIGQFDLAVRQDNSDVGAFWLRKSKKAVLAVLAVDVPIMRPGNMSPEREPSNKVRTKTEYFYGVNMEVSMPTGSLCAERNAIGTAVATYPGLHRRSMNAIAVFSADMPGSNGCNPIYPCGACTEWLKKIAEVNPDFKLITFVNGDCNDVIVQSIFTLTSTHESGEPSRPAPKQPASPAWH